MVKNPFVLYGYESEKYFCDRKQETHELQLLLENGNNVALIAPRRIGKTGLIENLFHQQPIRERYYTFLIDIYATKSIQEMVMAMGASMLSSLRPFGTRVMQRFTGFLSSLRSGISFDPMGIPSWNVEIGDIRQPQTTLDEIFRYISEADKPCLVAIDEFQAVAQYRQDKVEELLRTYIQHCRNANFIFAGSHRTMMGEIFLDPSHPFYQSTAMMSLAPIPLDKYTDFAVRLFSESGRHLLPETVSDIYQRFEGITWYMQRVLNGLYAVTLPGATCGPESIDVVIGDILQANEFTYQSMLFQLPLKQKELLVAISKAGKAQNITSAAFVRRYHLSSPSSVQSAMKGLLEKNFVTYALGVYEVYDRFFAMWLTRK